MGFWSLDSDSNLIPIQQSSVLQTLNRVRPNQPQHPSLVQPLPQILPKNPTKPPFNSLVNGQGIMGGLPDKVASNNLVQSGVLLNKGIGMVGFGALGLSNSPSNPVSSDGMARSNRDSSSVSPVPYVFNGSFQERSSATLKKIVDRRQRRMIKNRELAARSRAHKQAYTMELEAEDAKLKEQNHELLKKQAEIIKKQKNQVERNYLNGKRKAVTAYFTRQERGDAN